MRSIISLLCIVITQGTNDLSARVATRGIIGVTRCSIGVQAGAVFTRSLLDVVHRSVKKSFGGVSIYAVAR